MERIFIKHQTGSKANQTEIFSLADFKDITFGRDSSVEVKYDSDRDDLVSRQHARITCDSNNSSQFVLADLNSRNGTFVNKSRINSPHRLNHGDRVQFGSGGPEFIFELDPPPANSAKPTRLEQFSGNAQATREILTETRERKTGQSETRQPGRVTLLEQRIQAERYDMEDLLNDEKQNLNAQLEREKSTSRRLLINVAAGLVFMGVIGAGVFVYQNVQQQKQIIVAQQQLADAQKTAEQADSEIKAMKEVMSPRQIAEAYSQSTVLIESRWELVDKQGRKMYQMCVKKRKGGVYERSSDGLPVYFRTKDSIEPLLTVKPDEGIPIAGRTQGTGFVISEQGFILTNLHVYAPWQHLDSSVLSQEGYIWDFTKEKKEQFEDLNSEDKNALANWTAKNSAIFNDPSLFEKNLGGKGVKLEGRNIALDVIFPKTTVPYPARLVRESNEADVALLRIDVPEGLQGIPPIDIDSTVTTGQAVTVLGYPGISPKTFVQIQSKDLANTETRYREVPEPTLTSGWVAKVNRLNPHTKTESVYAFGEMNSYQLTINSTGSGNSGGPVFSDKGQVIGIFTYLRQKDGITVSFAVPIKYGRDLKMNRIELN
ncbi:MAG: FHA domain-containing protein [Methylobacter sp.]